MELRGDWSVKGSAGSTAESSLKTLKFSVLRLDRLDKSPSLCGDASREGDWRAAILWLSRWLRPARHCEGCDEAKLLL